MVHSPPVGPVAIVMNGGTCGLKGVRTGVLTPISQWSFLVPLIGGRYHIIPQLAVYTTYIPLIYCLLGDYISPTTY